MADSDKDIEITPNTGETTQPKIEFTGLAADPITLKVLDDNSLSFEGSEGQLFSITNNLTSGTLFSVNDVSGMPSIEVDADGTISLAAYGGNVGIGITDPQAPLEVVGGSYNIRIGPKNGWGGDSNPTVYSSSPDEWIMLNRPHIPYLENGVNGYAGSSQGAVIEFANQANVTTSWTAGIASNIGTDKFVIRRNASTTPFLAIDNNGNVGIGTTNASDGKLTISAGTNSQPAPVTALAILGPNSPGNENSSQDIRWNFSAAGGSFIRSYRGGSWNTYLAFGTTPISAGSNSPITRMTIDGEGNVGIGITSPIAPLHVDPPSNIRTLSLAPANRVAGNASYILMGNSDSGGAAGPSMIVAANRSLSFGVGDSFNSNIGGTFTANMTVDPSGNVGIGKTSPTAKLEIEGGSADWNEITPGTSVGTIHLDPGVNTYNYGNAITFGASDASNGDDAQAGIYVRSDSTYGTKMYFATTDTYVVGSKTRLFIDYTGNVGIGTTSPGTKLEVNGAIRGGFFSIAQTNTGEAWFGRGGDRTLGTYTLQLGGASATDTKFEIVDRAWSKVMFSVSGEAPGESFHINSAGNVGIGTGSPERRLHVKSSSEILALETTSTTGENWIRFKNGAGNLGYIGYGSSGNNHLDISNEAASSDISFYTSNTDRLRITSAGNVGIGTTDPQAQLEVAGGSYNIRIGPKNGWGGDSNPTVYGSGPDEWIMLNRPHIPYLENGVNGYIGSSQGAVIEFANQANVTTTWTVGIASNIGTDKFVIRRNSSATPFLAIDNTGNVGIGATSPGSKLHVYEPSTLSSTANQQLYKAIFQGLNGNTSYLEIKQVRDSAGSNWITAGTRIQQRTDSTYQGYIQFNGTGNQQGISFGTGGLSTAPGNVGEKMRITSAGNVGIGTTSPTQGKLVISTPDESTTSAISIRQSNDLDYGYDFALDQNLNGNGFLYGVTGGTKVEVMQWTRALSPSLFLLSGGGKVGIGTTNPGAKLSIGGGEAEENRLSFLASDNSGRFTIKTDLDGTTTNDLLIFNSTNAGDTLTIKGNGNVGIGTTIPNYRLDVTGDIRASSRFLSDGIIASPDGNLVFGLMPQGGFIRNTTGGFNDTFKITIPMSSVTVLMSFDVLISQANQGYSTNRTGRINLNISTLIASNNTVLTNTATVYGSNNTQRSRFRIRISRDTTNYYFWITDTVYNLDTLQVAIKDVQLGIAGGIAILNNPWTITTNLNSFNFSGTALADFYSEDAVTVKKTLAIESNSTGINDECLMFRRVNDFTKIWRMFVDQSGGALDGTLRWTYNQVARAYLGTGVNVSDLDFTGQHRNLPKQEDLFHEFVNKVGLIVVSEGEFVNFDGHNGISINEALPKVSLSSRRNQKNVFGVISDKEDENSNTRNYLQGAFGTSFEKRDDDNRLIINSLGEGGIWICNINGNLENGDYITSCEIPGYGMRQDDDLLHNYTVAKITCDCNFDLQSAIYICEEFEWEGQIYRKAFVGCTYHCG